MERRVSFASENVSCLARVVTRQVKPPLVTLASHMEMQVFVPGSLFLTHLHANGS